MQDKIDLETLSGEQVDQLSQEISVELAKIADETCKKIDQLLDKYNITSRLQIELVQKNTGE